MLSTILGVLKDLLAAIPAIRDLFKAFQKTPQNKVDDNVEDLRKEVDEFKKTGRPSK